MSLTIFFLLEEWLIIIRVRERTMLKKDFDVNLFILGAAKSGTTSLHSILSEHPDIFMSTPKEPLFFEAEYENGLEYYRDKYFSEWKGEPIVGESRHRNLYLPFIPGRILATYPKSRFLVILRNPVDRAYSHWWHWYSQGVEKRSFQAAVNENVRLLDEKSKWNEHQYATKYKETLNLHNGHSPYLSYIDSGYYAEQIERYFNIFGKDQVHITIFDDFATNPAVELKKIYEFLNIQCKEYIEQKPQNVSMGLLGRVMLSTLKLLPFRNYIPQKYRSGILHKITNYSRVPPIDHHIRKNLLDHFEPHTKALEGLIDRSLPNWR